MVQGPQQTPPSPPQSVDDCLNQALGGPSLSDTPSPPASSTPISRNETARLAAQNLQSLGHKGTPLFGNNLHQKALAHGKKPAEVAKGLVNKEITSRGYRPDQTLTSTHQPKTPESRADPNWIDKGLVADPRFSDKTLRFGGTSVSGPDRGVRHEATLGANPKLAVEWSQHRRELGKAQEELTDASSVFERQSSFFRQAAEAHDLQGMKTAFKAMQQAFQRNAAALNRVIALQPELEAEAAKTPGENEFVYRFAKDDLTKAKELITDEKSNLDYHADQFQKARQALLKAGVDPKELGSEPEVTPKTPKTLEGKTVAPEPIQAPSPAELPPTNIGGVPLSELGNKINETNHIIAAETSVREDNQRALADYRKTHPKPDAQSTLLEAAIAESNSVIQTGQEELAGYKAQLEQIPATDPRYDEAQALLFAHWPEVREEYLALL